MENFDRDILEQAKAGKLSAFEQILSAFERDIYSYLFRLTAHAQTAEDLTQETFIKLYRNLSKLDADKNFKSWLYAIATNVAKDYWRKQKQHRELLVETSEELVTIAAEDAYYEMEIPDSFDAERLHGALLNIKPQYRAALLLYYQHNYSYREIAEWLGVPLSSVKVYIFRGKQALKKALT